MGHADLQESARPPIPKPVEIGGGTDPANQWGELVGCHASTLGGLRWWIFVCGDSMVGMLAPPLVQA